MTAQRKSPRRVSVLRNSVRNAAKDRELEKLLHLASQYFKVARPRRAKVAAKAPSRKRVRVA